MNVLGNVAHDLRTPLQAFQSELEMIWKTTGLTFDENARQLQLQSIEQLDRITNFMNMVINRFVDFTKASSGRKLRSSIESINFAEMIKWSVGCMEQSPNVPIVVEPIPSAISERLFTDKQWLMENMLCLVSNAQKFTTDGKISVRCSLQSTHKPFKKMKKYSIVTEEASGDMEDDEEAAAAAVAGGTSSCGVETATPMVLIEVEDSGIGIENEMKELLFKPFAQVN